MANKTYKLGELLEISDERNSDDKYSLDDVKGISIQKIFIETKADMQDVSLTPYILVKPDYFCYVTVTSRNGEKITLAHNTSKDTYIVSSSYIVFYIKRPDLLNSDYLYMYFNRPEFDRYSRFNSWGSAREVFSWEDFCDIDITLPELKTQEKYVEIYEALVENQKSYERGLDDLKLTCDAYLDKLKKEKTIPLGDIIEKTDKRNINLEYGEDDVRGIINLKEFAETKADLIGTDLSKFKIIEKNEFAYNSRTDGRDMLVMALNRDDTPIIVTFNYNSFRIKPEIEKNVNTEFLYSFFKRSEFDRLVRFNSWGSSQELLSWEYLCDIKVPYPSIEIQQSIANVYEVYNERKAINEKLKSQIKDICPILIKGSLEEAKEA